MMPLFAAIPLLATATSVEEPVLRDSGVAFVVIGIWMLVLGIFAGSTLIARVPPNRIAALVSGANAISGITLIGALYCVGTAHSGAGKLLGLLAIVMATINVVGGFVVTERLLKPNVKPGPAAAETEPGR